MAELPGQGIDHLQARYVVTCVVHDSALVVRLRWLGWGSKAQKKLRRAVKLGWEEDEEASQHNREGAKPKQKVKAKAKAKGRPKAKPKQKAKAKAKGQSADNSAEDSDGAQEPAFSRPEKGPGRSTGLVPMTSEDPSEDSGEKKMQAEDEVIKSEHAEKKVRSRARKRTPKKKKLARCLDSEMEEAADKDTWVSAACMHACMHA